MSSTPDANTTARETARETAKNNPLENAKTLRGIYDEDSSMFPEWVLEPDRWGESDGEKSHKFDETIVVYDNDDDIEKVKKLVEEREPVNVEMHRYYTEANLEKNFGWKTGAYGKSKNSELYPNIGIYCRARVTNGVNKGAEEKNVHVMNLIGYAFDNITQPDYQYFLNLHGSDKSSLQGLDDSQKEKLKIDLIQRYRKIWLKACYICIKKGLKKLWYYGVGNGNFARLLPNEFNKEEIKTFYDEIFAPAFGIDPSDSPKKSTLIDPKDETIPINFCEKYRIEVQNLQKLTFPKTPLDTTIPDILFNGKSTPADTLYINAWDPWSIIGNENKMFRSLDAYWGRNSNMSVLGWSMTNSKLLPDIAGTRPANEKSKILSMKDILAEIEAAGGGGSGKAPVSGDSIVTGKVAQFFMTYKPKVIEGIEEKPSLNSYEQAQKIVNVVKCLMNKKYKHIGLTYSANQKQTIEVFSDYKYDKDSPDNTFADDTEKDISSEILNGANQASVLTKLNTIITNDASYSEFKKAFRVIPFTTMRYEKQGDPPQDIGVDLDESQPGNNRECIEAATKFLELEDSIILGWCNQDCGNMNDKTDTTQKFAIGGGIAAGLKFAKEKYIPQYLQFLTSVWNDDVQKIVNICNPNHASVDPPASSPPPKTSTKTNVALANVLTTLEGKLSKVSDDFSSLGLTLPDFLYPLNGNDTDKKNLNSADPAIDVMIKEFESATDEGDKNFYLGACKSIQAAYDLDVILAGTDNDKKMRAKLLLNLRKNSLLLKVPARWDYATMKLGEPDLTPPFSVPLQNETGVFCFENVAFQLLFSIDSVRKFSEKSFQEIDATKLCGSLTITDDEPYCNGVFTNTYDVLHKMSEQYKKDKSIPVEAEQSKKNLEQIKNKEVTEVYTQDGSQQADAADFLVYTILQYLKLYEPINNSICFKQYELTLCNNDIDDTEIKRLNVYKFDITNYEQVVDSKKKTYDFSKNSVLQKIGVKIDNKKLLDILNPVGVEQTALMCFTDGNSIQECINDYLIAKDLVINDDKGTETGQYQNELAQNSNCSKDNTIKRPVLYIPETQKYLIVILKRYTLKKGNTIIVDKNINVNEKITINKDIEYVNKYEFKLRGVICKTGSAGGGHYVYISYEDDKKILYNDYDRPTDFTTQFNMDTQGYVFLYEKVTSQAGGSNNIPRPITYTNAANTTHAASKSRHNSSFKASSSKTKGKSHNRSHTQRVK